MDSKFAGLLSALAAARNLVSLVLQVADPYGGGSSPFSHDRLLSATPFKKILVRNGFWMTYLIWRQDKQR